MLDIENNKSIVKSAARKVVYAWKRSIRRTGPGLLEFLEQDSKVPFNPSMDDMVDMIRSSWYDRVPTRKIDIWTSYSNGKRIMKNRASKKIVEHLIAKRKARRPDSLSSYQEAMAMARAQTKKELALIYGRKAFQQHVIDIR